MSNQKSESSQPTENWLLGELKKQLLPLILAGLWAFYTFIYNAHDSEKDFRYQLDANSKAIEKLIDSDTKQNEVQQQILLGLSKVSDAQNRMATDLRDIQNQQAENTRSLLNRK